MASLNYDKIPFISELIVNEIEEILENIKKEDSFSSTESLFKRLLKLQEEISILLFIYKIPISDSLWKFVKDFERVDNQREKEFIYNSIKYENYSINK